MKKLSLTTLGVIFSFMMISAQGSADTGTMKVYHAIETGDVSGLDNVIDQNIVDHTMNGDVQGLDSVKNMFMQMHSHIDNIKLDPVASASDGDYHFTLSRMTGTTNSDYMGMPARTPLDMTSVDLVRTQNGKAVEHWEFISPKDAMQMMHMSMMNSGHQNMNMNQNDSTEKKP